MKNILGCKKNSWNLNAGASMFLDPMRTYFLLFI